MAAEEQHRYAIYLYEHRFYEDAVRQLDEALHEEETSERWNDWATAQLGCGRFEEAERGFRRALQMNPEQTEAATNLGALLFSRGRWDEAITVLEAVSPKLDEQTRAQVAVLLEQCREQLIARADAAGAK